LSVHPLSPADAHVRERCKYIHVRSTASSLKPMSLTWASAGHTGLPDAMSCTVARGPEGWLKTVGRRDAAIELTWMYLQRVLSYSSGARV